MDQARLLLRPLRMELMQLLAEPRTCTELAAALKLTPQKAYYHVKVLEKAGLVDRVAERKVKGISEGIYRAAGDSVWISPELTAKLGGGRQVRRQVALGQLGELAGLVMEDARALAAEPDAPVMTVNAAIELASPADRKSFMEDVQEAIHQIARLYGASGELVDEGENYRLVLACYRQPEPKRDGESRN
jgi:DNA-binding transcriptional ArsR family regulator